MRSCARCTSTELITSWIPYRDRDSALLFPTYILFFRFNLPFFHRLHFCIRTFFFSSHICNNLNVILETRAIQRPNVCHFENVLFKIREKEKKKKNNKNMNVEWMVSLHLACKHLHPWHIYSSASLLCSSDEYTIMKAIHAGHRERILTHSLTQPPTHPLRRRNEM